MAKLVSFSMSFNGELLNRGFWLYVWDIGGPSGRQLYVGQTGDSSSEYASSPFSRIGAHLDLREKAKANSLTRQLRAIAVDPAHCSFEMTAIGPIFPEQADREAHRPFWQRITALETALSNRLRERGYSVIGTHRCPAEVDADLWGQVVEIMDKKFPVLAGQDSRDKQGPRPLAVAQGNTGG